MWLPALLAVSIPSVHIPDSPRAAAAARRASAVLAEALTALDASVGSPVYLRIFKQEKELELWVQPAGGGAWQLLKRYPICSFSGALGPKTRQGDFQAPEGAYTIGSQQLNPWSQFHLSFNLGYPNRYEQAQGWTGSALMVHGNCVSIGCYAMSDAGIEEIYTLVAAAIAAGQSGVPVHAFPFRMVPAALDAQRAAPWYAFWSTLQPVYQSFEDSRRPPAVEVTARGYRLREPASAQPASR